MDLKAFKRSLQEEDTPPTDSLALQALWHEALGRWDQAHELAQQAPDPDGAWVHAFLHRLRGHTTNAGYWYRRAGKPHAKGSVNEEWDEIVTTLLSD